RRGCARVSLLRRARGAGGHRNVLRSAGTGACRDGDGSVVRPSRRGGRDGRGGGAHPVSLPQRPLLNVHLHVVGVGIARGVLRLEVGAILPGLLVRVLGIRLGGVGGAVAELPEVGQRGRAALDVGLELDGEGRLALVGVRVGPREKRGSQILVLLGLRPGRGGGRRGGCRGGRGGGGRGGPPRRCVPPPGPPPPPPRGRRGAASRARGTHP